MPQAYSVSVKEFLRPERQFHQSSTQVETHWYGTVPGVPGTTVHSIGTVNKQLRFWQIQFSFMIQDSKKTIYMEIDLTT